jgi:hypothetical protein
MGGFPKMNMRERETQLSVETTSALAKAKALGKAEWLSKIPTKAMDCIKRQYELRQRKDALEEQLAEVDLEYDYYRFIVVPSRMEDEGIENLRISGVGLVYLSPVLRARIGPDKVAAYEWLRDTGHENLITETVNAQTLSSACKMILAKGEPITEHILIQALSQAVIKKG